MQAGPVTAADRTIRDLAVALRGEGLDVEGDERGSVLHVGTALRGDEAEPVEVRLTPTAVSEYLTDLGSGDGRADGRDERAFGMLVVLLLESLTAVHDGANNLTTQVDLRRGTNGRLGLVDTRLDRGAPAPPGAGQYIWAAERPEEDGGH